MTYTARYVHRLTGASTIDTLNTCQVTASSLDELHGKLSILSINSPNFRVIEVLDGDYTTQQSKKPKTGSSVDKQAVREDNTADFDEFIKTVRAYNIMGLS